ncbi:hypothetical protein ACLKA6_003447 [Drosophila palustris]
MHLGCAVVDRADQAMPGQAEQVAAGHLKRAENHVTCTTSASPDSCPCSSPISIASDILIPRYNAIASLVYDDVLVACGCWCIAAR